MFSIIVFLLSLIIQNDCHANEPNPALIVVDMQTFFMDRGVISKKKSNQDKVKEIMREQVRVIKEAKRNNIPIVFIEYENYGNTSKKLLRVAGKGKNIKIFQKDSDGVFDEQNSKIKEIETYLLSLNIDTLIITGANGGACIKATIEGALNKNFDVIAYDKAIADFNFPEFIYPYDKYLKDLIHHNCKECKFTETMEIEKVFNKNKNKGIKSKIDKLQKQIQKINSNSQGCE
jgi:nicotinamidase-related amidase